MLDCVEKKAVSCIKAKLALLLCHLSPGSFRQMTQYIIQCTETKPVTLATTRILRCLLT